MPKVKITVVKRAAYQDLIDTYIRKDPSNPYIGVIPNLRPYHDELRYIEIVERMNLPLGEFQ